MQINHIKYISKSASTGVLKKLYNRIELNFGALAEPFVLHSLNADLTAGVWTMLFETVLVEGKVKRSLKEAVANCVSEGNKCNYCVDAHSVMVFGTEKKLQRTISSVQNNSISPKLKEEKLISWALNNLNFEHELILNPPFCTDEALEIIATAVIFHYVNRMVTLFAGNTPLPTLKMKSFVKFVAANFIFKKALKKTKVKGESLQFIEKNISNDSFSWANDILEIQTSFQYFKNCSDLAVEKLLSPNLRKELKNQALNLGYLQASFGAQNLDSFLSKIKASEKAVATFCFLTMFETHKVQDKHFEKLKQNYSDKEIMEIAAFSSFIIAEQIGLKLYSNSH